MTSNFSYFKILCKEKELKMCVYNLYSEWLHSFELVTYCIVTATDFGSCSYIRSASLYYFVEVTLGNAPQQCSEFVWFASTRTSVVLSRRPHFSFPYVTLTSLIGYRASSFIAWVCCLFLESAEPSVTFVLKCLY